MNFNPRSPYGERRSSYRASLWAAKFQSTLPIRGATRLADPERHHSANFNPRSPYGERPPGATTKANARNFNPRSPCGERPYSHGEHVSGNAISIHAPHAGSDCYGSNCAGAIAISIHASHAGSDSDLIGLAVVSGIFQSTLPMRGATATALHSRWPTPYFNPRSPCGE